MHHLNSPFVAGAVVGPTENEMKVNPDRLAWWLRGYDSKVTDYLVSGFRNGFYIGYSGNPTSKTYKNHNSAYENTEVVDNYIKEELSKGRIEGPFNEPPGIYQCSPIGLVPKKDKGEFRVIHDLSYPPGQSVNDAISTEHTFVQYESVYDAIKMLAKIGDGAFMCKTDIEKAFRIIPLHLEVRHLFCMHWGGKYYIDKRMQMGCSSSCQIFETFSKAVAWIAHSKLGIPNTHYLDDFLFGSKSIEEGQSNLKKFLLMCKDIGIPIYAKKTFLPNTIMSFLGFEIDTLKKEFRLPLDKIEQCQKELLHLLGKKKAELREVQSVVGLLNFACQVVLPGRAFLRRLIDSTRAIKKPRHKCRIYKSHKDLQVWLNFLENHNGRCFFLSEKFISNHDLKLYTDSSKIGFAGIFRDRWFAGEWPSMWWKCQNIMLLELLPIVIAIEIWGCYFENQRLRIFTDNQSLVPVLNKQTSQEPTGLVMILVRRLVLACLKHNILIEAEHISGVLNVGADRLSRAKYKEFFDVCPQAQKVPCKFPPLPALLN